MTTDREPRETFRVDGRIVVSVREPGASSARIVRVRRPFALIGRHPDADILIDDANVESIHTLILLDARGLFGVDLLTATGTRFAGASAVSSWLGPGDLVEVAGRRIEVVQLVIGGRAINPPLATDELLAEVAPGVLETVTLERSGGDGPPWRIGSALAVLGRGAASAVRLDDPSIADTHCALFRCPAGVYVIDLLTGRTLVNDRPVEGGAWLVDGDILVLGEARFRLRVGPILEISGPGTALVPLARPLVEVEPSPAELVAAFRQLQSDAATLLQAQFERIEALNQEVISLRTEIRGQLPRPEPAPPLRLDLEPPTPRPSTAAESASWLLDRLQGLEREGESSRKDLLGRIAAALGPRSRVDREPKTP